MEYGLWALFVENGDGTVVHGRISSMGGEIVVMSGEVRRDHHWIYYKGTKSSCIQNKPYLYLIFIRSVVQPMVTLRRSRTAGLV